MVIHNSSSFHSIVSSPSSADIVDDIEKRIVIEINQLRKDIKRIEPSGESWCTFGDLFMDSDVQQYYEALVNTLKSAKRKRVIDFKGQILLKGMHDDVIVKVMDDSNEDVDVGVNSPLSNNDTHIRNSMDGTIVIDRESTRSMSPITKLCTPRKNLDSLLDKDTSQHSIPYVTPNDNEITDAKHSITSSNTMSHPKEKDMNVKSSMIDSSYNRSFASLSISQSERKIQSSPIDNIQNDDIKHLQAVGTTFISTNSVLSNHDDRIEREIKQLVKDIRRIEPHGENFCTFGVLFDDPDVEQYYEALVGTLKAARRQGVISFKGQMLLKGMHDLVKINIVE